MVPAAGMVEGERYYVVCHDVGGPVPELVYEDYFVYRSGVEPGVVEAIARELAAALPLAHPRPRTSPPVDGDQLVGLPTWLWVDAAGWETLELSETLGGVTVTAVAAPVRVEWDLGETGADDATLTCEGPGTPYTPGATDSGCTYTYRWVPPGPATTYPAAVTLVYQVTYTATGLPGGDLAGSLGTNSTTTTFDLTVTERQAVVTSA